MRATRLGHPVFTCAVAVLAVNDHILKRQWPGPATGKLSDVAGVVVVATLLSALLGRRTATVATAVGFIALKAIPAVAVAAAPVLGGVTRTDPTDLVALLALVPLWVWLRGGQTAPGTPSNHRRALAGAGVIAAVYATTATSCMRTDEITGVAVEDGVAYAFVDHVELLDDGGGPEEVYESHDGGATWATSRSDVAFADEAEACTGGGAVPRCWQVRHGAGVDECATAVGCAEVFSFTGEQRARLRCQSACGSDETFVAVAVLDDDDGGRPIVAMGPQGVLVGHPDGRWTRHAVGPSKPLSLAGPPAWTERLVVSPIGLGVAGFFVLIVGVAVKRTPYVWAGVAMVVAFVPLVIAGFVTSFETDGRWPGIVVAVLAAAVFVVSLVVATRSTPPRLEPPAWPRPPGPRPMPFT